MANITTPTSDELQKALAARRSAKSRVGLSHRKSVNASQEAKAEAKRNLAAANIAAYIHQQIAAAPQLSQEQIDRIVSILRAGGGP